ncbi:MAG: hypothetical protein V1694_03030 [Candidatus Eisenbacteria bacterium]
MADRSALKWMRPFLPVIVLVAALLTPVDSSAAGFSAANIDFLGRGGSLQGLTARPGEIDNVVWNPSGLAYFRSAKGLGFAGYMDYLVGFRGGAAGYMGSAGRLGYGSYIQYLSSTSLTVTSWDDPTGGRGESFSSGEMVVGVSCGAKILPVLALGGGLKLAREAIDDETAEGALADLSGTLSLGAHTYVGIVGRNLVLGLWSADLGKPPTNVEAALAVVLAEGRTSAGISLGFARAGRREARLGISALLSDDFEARFGYGRRIGIASDSAYGFTWARGLTAGFGIWLGRFWIDYTYEDTSPLDGIHRFAVRAAAGR